MYVGTDFAKDWTDQGYPVEMGTVQKSSVHAEFL